MSETSTPYTHEFLCQAADNQGGTTSDAGSPATSPSRLAEAKRIASAILDQALTYDVGSASCGEYDDVAAAITSALLAAQERGTRGEDWDPTSGEPALVYGKWDGETHSDIWEGWAPAYGNGSFWNAVATDGYGVWCCDPVAIRRLPPPPPSQGEVGANAPSEVVHIDGKSLDTIKSAEVSHPGGDDA